MTTTGEVVPPTGPDRPAGIAGRLLVLLRPVRSSRERLSYLATGAVLAVLTWLALEKVGGNVIPLFRGSHVMEGFAVFDALVGVSRARALLWLGALLVCVLYGVIGYTPWVASAVREMQRADPIRPAEAVVVLSTDLFPTGELPDQARLRLLRGLELLAQRRARNLVVTQVRSWSSREATVRQMTALGLQAPVYEVGLVRSTRDEALLVKELAQTQKWKRILLVTDPTHTRRAAATFEKVGLEVISVPSAWRRYDPRGPMSPGNRLEAFREWVYEITGVLVYRRNGWI